MSTLILFLMACGAHHRAQVPAAAAQAPATEAMVRPDDGSITPLRPTALGSTLEVSWAWAAGSRGEDRAAALADSPRGGFFLVSEVSTVIPETLPPGVAVSRVDAQGLPLWTTTVAEAGSDVRLRQAYGTDDGGVWVCGLAPGGATLADQEVAVPLHWAGALVALHLDAQGQVDGTRVLGAVDGGGIAGGCGLDDAQGLVLAGMVDDSDLQLITNHSEARVTDAPIAQGFAMALTPDGGWEQLSTWQAPGAAPTTAAVLADGSLVLHLAYTGTPVLQVGAQDLQVLVPCAEDRTCDALVHVDALGDLQWASSIGPLAPGGVVLSATPDGGVLFARPVRETVPLPQVTTDSVLLPAGPAVIARYDEKMGLAWTTRAGPDQPVEALADTRDGGALVAMWTGASPVVRLGDRRLPLEHLDGSLALGEVRPDGRTAWLWRASGDGSIRPTDLAPGHGGFAVAGALRGEVTLDPDGPTETDLQSLPAQSGLPSRDVVLMHLVPRVPVASASGAGDGD